MLRYNSKGEQVTSLSCDEDFDVVLTYDVRQKVSGIYGYCAIDRQRDLVRVFQGISNNTEYNYFERLPIGISTVRMHFPKRLLAAGKYIINLTLASRTSAYTHTLDRVVPCLKFELNEYNTNQTNRREGFFSTLIDWEIMGK